MAASAKFRLRYDGREAASHMLDMRALGTSLIGVERIVASYIFVAFEGRLPRPRERPDVSIVVAAPQAHCVDIPAALETLSGVLPFAQSILVQFGTDFVGRALAYVLSKLGGRPKEADVHFTALLELTKQMQEAHLQQTSQHVSLNLQTQANMLELVERLRPAAIQAVTPVGRSCERFILPPFHGGETTEIDAAMADAIRAKEPLEVGDMERYEVHVDTVSISRRSMKVRMINGDDSLLDVAIRDPLFDANPDQNIYTESLGRDLAIDAKPTYRQASGDLVKLHAMNALHL